LGPGAIDSQWIRKTVLTAENSFPEMLMRQRVVGSFEIEVCSSIVRRFVGSDQENHKLS
jgi:hypothetical protein